MSYRLTLCLLIGIGLSDTPHAQDPAAATTQGDSPSVTESADATGIATFAGGCFWCMEPPFDKLPGVSATVSGYIGGRNPNPTYKQVSSGRTGHAEAMQVKFDPNVVSYEQLLTLFWHNVDPTDARGQFCDKGNQYRTAIFFHSDQQKELAEASKQQVAEELGQRVRTQIVAAKEFYPAEDYHQDYYQKNPTKYKFYRWKCGRDARLTELWGDKAGQP